MGEKGKISIRNIRREANEELKKLKEKINFRGSKVKILKKIYRNLTDTNIEARRKTI